MNEIYRMDHQCHPVSNVVTKDNLERLVEEDVNSVRSVEIRGIAVEDSIVKEVNLEDVEAERATTNEVEVARDVVEVARDAEEDVTAMNVANS